jgi:thiosulfate/3-mercaptopyruvate sulfurtransferase
MQIDPRGPRFGAFITATVLAVVLVTGSVWLLAAQALVFAAGAAFGLRYAPYGWLDSRETVTEVSYRPWTAYRAGEPDASIRAYRDEVVAAIGRVNLVDVRSPDEFAGRLLAPAHLPQEQAQRGGHIPTATNVPWSKAAAEDGTFKTDEELRALYAGAGVEFGRDTIAYCRVGERSAHTWFVLHELLGQPNVKNYDGSWTEYGSLVGVPIELGEG